MRLTLHADYSMRVLIYLACYQDRLVSTAEISKAYDISRHHLVRVVLKLGHKGFIKVQPGRGGGLRLARDAQEIVIGEVIRATEPDFHWVECFGDQSACPISPTCALKDILGEAGKAFLKVLNSYTLADVVTPANTQLRNYFLKPLVLKRSSKAKDLQS